MSRVCKVSPVVFTDSDKHGDLAWMAQHRDDKTAFLTFDVQELVRTEYAGTGTAALRPYNQYRTDGEKPFVYSMIVGESATRPFRFSDSTQYEFKRLVTRDLMSLALFLRAHKYTRLVVSVKMVDGKPEIATRQGYWVDPRFKEWIMQGLEDLCNGDM